MPKSIEQYCEDYATESDLDLVARNLAIDGADGGTISRVIRRLRSGDPRDFAGYAPLYRALHQANPHLAHEFALRFAELSPLVARGDKPESDLGALFRYYTQELARPASDRSAGIPPAPTQSDISLGGSVSA